MSTTPAIIELVQAQGAQGLPTDEAMEQYNTETHKVFDVTKRKKRKITAPTGEFQKDASGNFLKVDGLPVPVYKSTYEEVNRIALPLQKLIVRRRAAFMNTGNMTILAKPANDTEERLLKMVKKCRDDNKMQYASTELAERKMSELQAAELWYSEEAEKGYWGNLSSIATKRMRMKILSPALGDKLFPVYDASGKMVYFGRGYKTKPDLTSLIDFSNPEAVSATTVDQTEIEHLDIYSKDGVLKFELQKGVWSLADKVEYPYKKLPVIYYPQDETEWHDVQHLIERIETLWSNFADVVDANASPVLFAKGTIKSMPMRGETAKVINVVPQINKDGKEVGESDLKYITWDSAPEAIKLESENVLNAIYFGTDTADISTKGMSDLGVKSGTGFDRVFIGSHLAAMRHTNGQYGECTQRSINFLVSACVAIDHTLGKAAQMEMRPEFPLFRINDERETIDMLMVATGGKAVLAQETATGMTGLVQDPEKEFARIKAEEDTLGKEIDNSI